MSKDFKELVQPFDFAEVFQNMGINTKEAYKVVITFDVSLPVIAEVWSRKLNLDGSELVETFKKYNLVEKEND